MMVGLGVGLCRHSARILSASLEKSSRVPVFNLDKSEIQFAPINSRQLSRIMDINPGTISLYVQRLVEKGLIQKEQDTKDRRTWWLTLTELGQMVASKVVASAIAYTRDFLSVLSPEEQHALHRSLLKASHSLGFDWQ